MDHRTVELGFVHVGDGMFGIGRGVIYDVSGATVRHDCSG